jgi:hypothetical protein
LQKSLRPFWELGAWAPPLGAVVAWLLLFELGAWAPPPALPTVLAGACVAGALLPPELLDGELDPVAPVAPVLPVAPLLLSIGGASSPPGTVSAGAGGSVWAFSLLPEPPQAETSSPKATTTSVRASQRRMCGI